jgi:hypothetical protein
MAERLASPTVSRGACSRSTMGQRAVSTPSCRNRCKPGSCGRTAWRNWLWPMQWPCPSGPSWSGSGHRHRLTSATCVAPSRARTEHPVSAHVVLRSAEGGADDGPGAAVATGQRCATSTQAPTAGQARGRSAPALTGAPPAITTAPTGVRLGRTACAERSRGSPADQRRVAAYPTRPS